MPAADTTDATRTLPTVASFAAFAVSVADGTTNAALHADGRIPTRHAKHVVVGVQSTQAITVFLRRYFNARTFSVDDAGTSVAANTPAAIVYSETVGLGDEAEIRVTNASGAAATVDAQILARS